MNVTAMVDAGGSVLERYAYDAYGRATLMRADWSRTQVDQEPAGTLSEWWNEVLYCGYRYDWETGNYHVRNRNYHPSLGRFTSRDPAGYNDGLNVYQYGQSDPAGTTDPMGLDSGWWEWNKGFWKTCLQQTNPGIRAVVYGRQAVDTALAGDRWGTARAMMAVWSIDGGLLAKADQARADAAEYLVYRQMYGVADSLCLLGINKCLGDETGYTKIADSLERRTRMGGYVPAEEAGSSAAEGGLQVAGTVGKIVGLLYAIPVGAGAGAGAGAPGQAPATVRVAPKAPLTLDRKITLRGANEAILEPWKAPGCSRLASKIPTYVYRGDARSPAGIFNKGFCSRGTNMGLRQHLLDNADPPSAFVSTSKSLEVARDFGEYVYVVRVRNGLNTNALVWRNSPMQEISIP